MALTPKQTLFTQYYLIDRNATQAALKAGFSPRTAKEQGSRLLTNHLIVAAIKERDRELTKSIIVDKQMVLDRWSEVAFKDASTLIATKVGACRWCHGVEHQYQYTQGEFQLRCEEAENYAERNGVEDFSGLPDPAGGFGYDPRRDPHPDCPECFGEGVPRTVVGNSKGNPLYAGAKRTKDGLEIKMHDQMAALNNIAKNLGMLRDQVDLNAVVEVDNRDTRALAIAAMALFRKTIESK